MTKNCTIRLVFQTVFCTLAVIGFLAQLGLYDGLLNQSYLVYYTNLSNLICMVFMFASLSKTVRQASRKQDAYCDFAPALKFLFVIMILITCILYNGLLAKYPTVLAYFSSLKNGLNHLILPVLFVLDWVLFYERGRVKWYYPLLAISIPFVYVVYILLRAAIVELAGIAVAVVYPYYFLNVPQLGWAGFLRWMMILLAFVLALGYGIWILDKWLSRKQIVAKGGSL